MTRSFATVIYEKEEAVAIASLNRPHVLNAYNTQMRDDLYQVLQAVRDDPEVRVMILRGEGPAFCTGGDVREFGTAPSPVVAREVRWKRDVWGLLLGLRQPTIAAVHGYVVGGGVEMALLCDMCVAADNAAFFFPETGLGMIPGVGGTQTVPRAVGLGIALEMILAGRRLTATEALRMGLINHLVGRGQLFDTVLRWARRIAQSDVSMVSQAKAAIRRGMEIPLTEGLQLESRLCQRICAPLGRVTGRMQ